MKKHLLAVAERGITMELRHISGKIDDELLPALGDALAEGFEVLKMELSWIAVPDGAGTIQTPVMIAILKKEPRV